MTDEYVRRAEVYALTRIFGEWPRTPARLPAAGRATKLYDRTNNPISLAEIGGIQVGFRRHLAIC